MPQNFLIPATPAGYRALIDDYQRSLFGNAFDNQISADGVIDFGHSLRRFYDFADLYNQLIFGNNHAEIHTQHLENLAENVFFIANQMGGGGGAGLDTIEFYLQSINQNTENVAAAIGGGAQGSFFDVVNAINLQSSIFQQEFEPLFHARLSEIRQQIFFDIGEPTRAVANNLAAHATLLAQAILAAAGTGSPFDAAQVSATQNIADSTQTAALDDALLQALSAAFSEADADDYHDHVVSSGPLALVGLAARLWPLLRTVLAAGKSAAQVGGAVAVGDVLFNEGRMTVKTIDPVMHWFARGLATVAPLLAKLVNTGVEVAEEASKPLELFFQPVFEKLLGSIKTSVAQVGEVGPAQGFEVAEQFLTRAALQGMHAHHLAEVIEMMPYFKHFGMHMLPAFMSDMAGFGPIAGNTWGRAVGEGVGRAAGYEINAKMRSRIPDVGQLIEGTIERKMSLQEQATLLAFHGYNDHFIDFIQKYQWKDPSLTQIRALADDISVDEAQVQHWLREAGFDDDNVRTMAPVIMAASMRTERGQLLTEVMSNLKEGFLTEQDAALYFDQLRLGPIARGFLLTASRLGFRRNLINDNLATYREQFRANLIAEGDFRLGLSLNGLDPARIDSEVANINTKRTATLAREEDQAEKSLVRQHQSLVTQELRVAFQHGMIDASAFELALIQSGINPDIARATVDLEEVRLAGRIGQARAAELARLTEREVQIRVTGFVELFRKQQISNLQLGQFLLNLGLEPSLVDAIVQREVARAAPTAADLLQTPAALRAKELATLAKTTLIVRFQKGLISSDDLLRGLVELGVDAGIARATVDLEVAKRQSEAQPPQAPKEDPAVAAALRRQMTALISAYVDKRISEATLISELQRLGATDVVVNALVQEALEKRALAELPAGAEV